MGTSVTLEIFMNTEQQGRAEQQGHAAPQNGPDYVIDQRWEAYSQAEHAVWRTLYARQEKLLPNRILPAYLRGLEALSIRGDGIPDFRRLSDVLMKATGWQVVAVPGLIPEQAFFEHLANRRFPAGNFIRHADQLDYLEEPDIFHDVFGHVPLLMDPVFADYMQAYGLGGLRAMNLNVLDNLARLYWYTVEFGLVKTADGLRIYGAGIASSRTETVFSLESDSPNRLGFDLQRVLCTNYIIDDFQRTYFVIDNIQSLLDLATQDFAPIYARIKTLPEHQAGVLLPTDTIISRGTGAYHASA